MIEFGPWLPDLPPHNNPGVVDAKNVLPAQNSYEPWPGQTVFSDAITAYPRGAISARDSDNNVRLYVGDATKLYEISGNSWTNVSQGGGADAYSLADAESWEFTKFGEKIIAASGVNTDTAIPDTNDLQIITMGGANFADLGGTPPQARHIATVRDFIVVGNTWDGTDGAVAHRVRWSGKGNEATWAVSASTQADYEDSLKGGWCQRIVGGEYGIVFMENAIYRMTYVGSPVVWQFDEVSLNEGCLEPNSVAQHGNLIFYLSHNGFNLLENGSQIRHIGANKVDRWFLADFDQAYRYRMSTAVDPNNHRVFWSYPGLSNTGGAPNMVICYDWSVDRWSYSDQAALWMLSAGTPGYDMDSAGALGMDSINTDLDAILESLDSNVWKGSGEKIAVMDSDRKLAFWSGANLTGSIKTGEMELTPGRRTLLTSVRPVVDGGTTTIAIGSRNRQQDSITTLPAASVSAAGEVTRRKNARYHTLTASLSGAYTHARGFEVKGQPAGRR